MFIKYLLARLVLSLTFMIVQAARLNDARPSGIRKKPPTPQKSRIARVKPSNDPSRGQPLYIVLECNTAPQDNQDSEKAREQISQFLSSQEIWDKLNLDKYRKRNSLEGSRVEALIKCINIPILKTTEQLYTSPLRDLKNAMESPMDVKRRSFESRQLRIF